MPFGKTAGFTLVGLMMVMVVIAILAVISHPGFNRGLCSNPLATVSNEVQTFLGSARLEAQKGGASTGGCPSFDSAACESGTDWSTGGWVWRDHHDANGIARRVVRYSVQPTSIMLTRLDSAVEFAVQARLGEGTQIFQVVPSDAREPSHGNMFNAGGQCRMSPGGYA